MLALVLAFAVSATPVEVELHYIAPGTALKLQTGEEVRYYNFLEYKLLLKLDGDLWELSRRLEVYKDLDLKYTGILGQKDVIIRTLQGDNQVLAGQLKRAEDNWHSAEKKLIDASGGPVWPYYLAAGGVVVGIVGATLYATTLVKH